jgi:hypothetical protein
MRWFTLLMILPCALSIAADDAPRVPCASDPNPAYAAVDGDPAVRVWASAQSAIGVDSACAPTKDGKFAMVAALSGRFGETGGIDKLLARLGSMSNMQAIRYWSVSDKHWTTLFFRSSALSGPSAVQTRGDFSAAEMRAGQDLYFAQSDSRFRQQAVYRMRVLATGSDEAAVEVENVTPIRASIVFIPVTVFAPGELRTVHFFKRSPGDVWNYYLLTLANGARAQGQQSSLVNRAAALFRYAAGQQTEREPPLAPR